MRTIKCRIQKYVTLPAVGLSGGRYAAKRIEVIFYSTILSVRCTLTLFENRVAVKVW